MSSKVLRGGEGGRAQAMVWPRAEGNGPLQPLAAAAAAQAAPEDSARLVAEARAEGERQAREARQAGYREGEAAGRRAAEAELRPVLERLTRSIDEVARLRPALAAQAEAGLLKLSVAIARRVLHREISLDPDALAGIVRTALEKLQIDEVCRVRAHPEQAAMLRAAFEKTAGTRPVEVQADPSLERGGVLVETGRGKLDLSVDSQLAEIERGLADRLRRHA